VLILHEDTILKAKNRYQIDQTLYMSAIQIPPHLKAGDTIGICAPARKITRDELAPAVSELQLLGFNVLFAPNLFGAENQFSGTDVQRTEDFQFLLDNPDVKAIISARGGYGTMRIIDQFRFDQFKKYPKWIVGYSDITVLHSHIHRHCNVATLHATMPINFLQDAQSTQTLIGALKGETIRYEEKNETGVKNIPGKAKGVLVGGNLSLLYALQCSQSDIDTNGKILFLEDLDEYLYHIDRMVLSLDRAGKFAGIKGLIVGSMSLMKDNIVPFGKTAEEIILSHVSKYNFPVAFGFPAGHDVKNYALKLGVEVEMEVGEEVAVLG
jgi:muramoyltetrapeptide carboxypeptidase